MQLTETIKVLCSLAVAYTDNVALRKYQTVYVSQDCNLVCCSIGMIFYELFIIQVKYYHRRAKLYA